MIDATDVTDVIDVTDVTDDVTDVTDVIDVADTALYEDLHAGQQRVHLAPRRPDAQRQMGYAGEEQWRVEGRGGENKHI